MKALMLLLLLTACGGATPAPPSLTDEPLGQQLRAARLALDAGRSEEAARQYALALRRARERDSAEDIADAATGRAAALLAQGQSATAQQETAAVSAELRRRGATVPPPLLLAEAIARFRQGDQAGALPLLRALRGSADRDAALRAVFVEGLIAAARQDAPTLAEARSLLGAPESSAFRADSAELAAHAALLARDAPVALTESETAIALRRDNLDYRGVGRALELAADAARLANQREREADFALRAAQGAAVRGEKPEARRLLQRARTATADPALRTAIAREEAALDAP